MRLVSPLLFFLAICATAAGPYEVGYAADVGMAFQLSANAGAPRTEAPPSVFPEPSGNDARGATEQPSTSSPGEKAISWDNLSDPAMVRKLVANLMVVRLTGTTRPQREELDYIKNYPPGVIFLSATLDTAGLALYVAQVFSAYPSALPPPLLAISYENIPVKGKAQDVPYVPTPSMLTVAATGEARWAQVYADTIGEALAAAGLNTFLGPTFSLGPSLADARPDVDHWGSLATLAAEAAPEMIRAFQTRGVLAIAWDCPGGAANRRVNAPAVLSTPYALLMDTDAKPYAAAVAGGLEALHVGTTLVPTLEQSPTPACISPAVIKSLVREGLHFRGVILAGPMDDPSVLATPLGEEAPLTALVHGADMLLWSGGTGRVMRATDRLVQEILHGSLPRERLREALERSWVLRQKYAAGNGADTKGKGRGLDVAKVTERLAEVEGRGVVLLKNSHGALPLRKELSPVLVTGVEGVQYLESTLAKHVKNVVGFTITSARHSGTIEDFELDRIRAHFAGVQTALCVCNPHIRIESQRRLLETLRGMARHLVVISLGMPPPLTDFPNADACVVAFPRSPGNRLTYDAVVDVLTGRAPVGLRAPSSGLSVRRNEARTYDVARITTSPVGRLPSALNEAYPVGFGMTLDVPTPFKSVTWDFGNGVTQTGPTVTYAYPVPGTYTVTVTASGRDKTQSTTAFMVNVEP